MITEDYVSYEVARLLKEKGFDEGCRSYYYDNGKDYDICFRNISKRDMNEDEVLRPTLQMAMQWLREEHNRYITILTSCELDYPTFIFRIERYAKPLFFTDIQSNELYNSYEDAVEVAIQYCLTNLI